MTEKSSINSPNDSMISNSVAPSKRQSKLPKITERTLMMLKTKKLHNLNFNVMLNLPLIVKEKGIFERKNTIQIFKRKKFESVNISSKEKKGEKQQILSSGRIYINEFWSEKYQQQILKESKIAEQLASLKGLIRRNVDELVNDVHSVVQHKLGGVRQYLNQ